jgi:hypothetical protein
LGHSFETTQLALDIAMFSKLTKLPKTGKEETNGYKDHSQNNPACLLNPSHILGNAHGYLLVSRKTLGDGRVEIA